MSRTVIFEPDPPSMPESIANFDAKADALRALVNVAAGVTPPTEGTAQDAIERLVDALQISDALPILARLLETDDTAAVDGASALQIIDVSAPEGMEVAETTAAKNIAMDRVQDVIDHLLWLLAKDEDDVQMLNHDAITVADDIVEALIKTGWRPTEAVIA